MSAVYTEYYVQLVNKRTKATIDDDTGKFIVLTAGSAVLQTIYSDENGAVPAFVYSNVTSTMTDGVIRFFTALSVTSVDLSILTAGGQAIFVKSLTPSQHRVEVDTEQPDQILVLPVYNYIPTPFTSASITATASVWGQGMSLPAGILVKDVYSNIETLGTGALVNIGISGTPSGLQQQITGSVTGVHIPISLVATAATATFYFGSLLATTTQFVPLPYFVPAVTGLVFNNVTVTTLAAMTGWVYIRYDLLPNSTG